MLSHRTWPSTSPLLTTRPALRLTSFSHSWLSQNLSFIARIFNAPWELRTELPECTQLLSSCLSSLMRFTLLPFYPMLYHGLYKAWVSLSPEKFYVPPRFVLFTLFPVHHKHAITSQRPGHCALSHRSTCCQAESVDE